MYSKIILYISILTISGILLTYSTSIIYSIEGDRGSLEKSLRLKNYFNRLESFILREKLRFLIGFSRNISIYLVYNLGVFEFKMPITYIFIDKNCFEINPHILSNSSFIDIYGNQTFIGIRSNIFLNKSGEDIVVINLVGIYVEEVFYRDIDGVRVFFNISERKTYSFTTNFLKIRVDGEEYTVNGLHRFLIYITIYKVEIYADR